MQRTYKILILCLIVSITFAGLKLRADSVDDLKAKSADLSDQIKQIDARLLIINKQLNTATGQKNTLNNELKQIDATRTKLLTELSKTEKQINISSNNIQVLSTEISGKVKDINQNQTAIAESLRGLNEEEKAGFLELALSDGQLSDLVGQIETLEKLQGNLDANVESLKSNKQTLEVKKSATETEKKTLTDLKSQLSSQKQVVEQTKQEKSTLLTQTKNQESAYQKLLSDELAKKKAVEDEQANIEKQIQIIINPSSLPKTGTGLLAYPVSRVIITQYFGNTDFATKNPQVYNGKGHNGVDFGASIGTTIMAAADGFVVGEGNTDQTCPKASYGKWILLQHPNGLSTLYGHLSVFKVSTGDTVTAGQAIALSGNTGYTTGPHLHFTVYATPGVKISSAQSKVKGCGVYTMPFASYSSYLNPLSYLPAQ